VTAKMPRCFKIHERDNVATLLDDAPAGEVQVLNAGSGEIVNLSEAIAVGHKVALEAIDSGAAVVKYGIPIGHASHAIRPGQWVHLHNCASNFDERSGTLDVHSGATTDTKYE
jgi:altronate dehydratase small subunit